MGAKSPDPIGAALAEAAQGALNTLEDYQSAQHEAHPSSASLTLWLDIVDLCDKADRIVALLSAETMGAS